MKTLGEKIAALRTEKHLTQSVFAKSLCVTRQAVSSWERDKTEPDVATLKRICELLETDMNDLILDVRLEQKRIDTWPMTALVLAILAVNLGFLAVLMQRTKDLGAALSQFSFRIAYVLIATSVYMAMTHCVRSRDFSILSGYDAHAPYDKEVMAQMTAAMELMILADTLGFSILSVILHGQIGSRASAVIFFAYIACFLMVILFINFKYKDRLYRDPEYPLKIRSGNKITLFFLSFVALGAAVLIVLGVSGAIEHNSAEAALQVLFFLPYIFINVIWMMIEQDKLHKVIDQGETYQFGRNTAAVAAVNAVILITMVLIGLP